MNISQQDGNSRCSCSAEWWMDTKTDNVDEVKHGQHQPRIENSQQIKCKSMQRKRRSTTPPESGKCFFIWYARWYEAICKWQK